MDRDQVQQTSVTGMESKNSIHRLDSKHNKDNTSNGGDTSSYNTDSDEGSGIKFKDWGFQVDRLFEVAYRFYKRNESKAFHPSFDERNQLIALILQARYGNFDGIKAPDVGTLDLVGKNRRQQWATLTGMSKTEAMSKFISTLDELCPFFKAHVEAVKISCGTDSFVDKLTTAGQQILNDSSNGKEDTKPRAIYTSLCRQTYEQFKGYAMKQYPNDVQQQKYLIASLQEQYYQQYISQMHPDLSNSSPKDNAKASLSPAASETSSLLHESSDSLLTNHERGGHCMDSASQDDVAQSVGNGTQVSPVENSENIPSLLPELKTEQTPELTASSNHPPSNQDASDTSNNRHHSSLSQANLVSGKEVNPEPNFPKPNPYQPTDLQSIGKFESFPEPKPIPSKAHPSSISTTTTKTQAIASNGNKRESQQPAHTTIDLSGQPIAREDSFSLLPAPPLQELPPPPELVSRRPIEHNLTPSAQQELLPPPQFGHESTTSRQLCDMNLAIDQPPSSDNSDCRVALNQTNEPTFALENKPPVELWGCDGVSSSGSDSAQDDSPLEQSDTSRSLEPASTWTKRGVNDFKDSLVDDKHGGVYIVKQGTLVTIQVPTYPDGKYIYWEFATEDYDIGFGLDFIYETNLMQPLAIKISEETDEDDDDDCDEIEGKILNQMSDETETPVIVNRVLNSIEQKRAEKFAMIANTVSIIPTYRRDSHEEIFVGRHRYPGKGYYLLKFDNTYSVLRSKSLYFRICYFI